VTIRNETNNCVEKSFLEHANMVYRLAYARTKSKHDADDILQEVFIRLMTSNTRFSDK
jgi:RNA polymerase sigma-70 factor (ECF subfamily)